MADTSKKHRNFTAEHMGEKLVTDLPGIGPVLGGKLMERGIDRAYIVLGQFLWLKMDEEMFRIWLKETCNANVKQQGDCFRCLSDWCNNFL